MKGNYIYIVVMIRPIQWGCIIEKIVSVHNDKKVADAFVADKESKPLAAKYEVIKKKIK